MAGWPGGSTGALAHSPLPERYSSECSRETTPLHDEVWEPLPCGSLSQAKVEAWLWLSVRLLEQIPGDPSPLCLCFPLEPGRAAPSDSSSLPVPRRSVWGSVLDDLLGFHSLSARRISSRCFLAAPVLAQDRSSWDSVALAFLPRLGWWKACASKAVFTSFLLLRTFSPSCRIPFPITLPSLAALSMLLLLTVMFLSLF